MTKIFTESDQTVSFPSDWWVIKLDEHRYYRRLSGQGLKAVDFLALHDDFGLMLIELKNYHGRPVPADLGLTMEEKSADTARLIHIVNRYLQRKLYYRIFFSWLKWYRICDREWIFWYKAQQQIEKGNTVKLLDVQR